MPIIIPAIAAAATVGGALISSHASNTAAGDALTAAQENNALQEQIYNSNKGLETPFINSGYGAMNELNGFLGLSGDPKAADAAFQKYLDSTGYKFDYGQGIGAVENSKAASGLLGSGSLVKSLDAFGTGLADSYGQQYVGNLQNLVGTGAGSANALAGQGQSYANAVSSNNNSAASAAGNAALLNASNINNLLGNAFKGSGSLVGGTSFGGGGGTNAFAPGMIGG
jgi:hypothetical protein